MDSNKTYIIGSHYLKMRHRDSTMTVLSNKQWFDNINHKLDVKHIITIGDLNKNMECMYKYRKFKVGFIYSNNPKFEQLFDTTLDLNHKTIESLTNAYNGHFVSFQINPHQGLNSKQQMKQYGFTIKDSNNAKIVQDLSFELEKEPYIHVIFNRLDQTLSIVRSNHYIYQQSKQDINIISTITTTDKQKIKGFTWYFGSYYGQYKYHCDGRYQLNNINNDTRYILCIECTNHNLTKRCEKGWDIPIKHTVTYGNNIKIINKTNINADFEHICGNLNTFYKSFETQNVSWGNV